MEGKAGLPLGIVNAATTRGHIGDLQSAGLGQVLGPSALAATGWTGNDGDRVSHSGWLGGHHKRLKVDCTVKKAGRYQAGFSPHHSCSSGLRRRTATPG